MGDHDSYSDTGLTTNGCYTLQIKQLAVRPEPRRRAPKEFSHSLANARDPRKISPGVYPEFAEGVEMTSIPNLASLRLCERHIRIRENSPPEKFAQAAQIITHSSAK